MRPHCCVVLVAVCLAVTTPLASEECGFRWVNPIPPRVDLHRVFERSGLLVVVGARGTIATSSDGMRWVLGLNGSSADLNGVDWGMGYFIAVGDGVVLSSSNGELWTPRWQDAGASLDDVEFGSGRFVAVGRDLGSRILSSESGTHWSFVEVPWSGGASAVVWTGEEFLVASTEGAFRSPDGLVWEFMSLPPAAGRSLPRKTESQRMDLAWDGTRYFWVEGMQAFASADARQWELVYTLDGCESFSGLLAVWAEPGLVMVGGASACPDPYINPFSRIAVSTTGGDDWLPVVDERGGGITSLLHVGARYLAVGGSGELRLGSSLSSWQCVPGTCTDEACVDGFFDVATAAGQRVAVGGLGRCSGISKRFTGATVLDSPDGRTWTLHELEIERLLAVSATATGFVAVGDDFSAASSDGATWLAEDLGHDALLTAIADSGSQLVAVGFDGVILGSEDGLQWDTCFSHGTGNLYGVEWTGERFVAVGEQGNVQLSLDGAHWSSPIGLTTRDLYGAAASDRRLYVAGDDGLIFSTEDGATWRQEESGVDGAIRDLSWDGERLLAVGSEPAADGETGAAIVLISHDGSHWSRLTAPGFGLRRVVSTAGESLAVGFDRSALRASCYPVFVTIDPPRSEIGIGDTLELRVEFSEAVSADMVVEIASSDPLALEVPGSVEVSAGGSSATLLATGVRLVAGARITVTLQTQAGNSTAAAEIDVEPPLPDPRRVNGRRHP